MTNEYDQLIQGAPELNEYDALLKDQAGATRTNLLTSGKAAQAVDPDARARQLQQAQALQMPADLIARNPDKVAELQQINEYDQLLQSSPKLSKWLAESQDNAALAKDDHTTLSAIERGFDAFVNRSPLTPVFDVQRAFAGEVVRLPGTILSGTGALIDAGARTIDRSVRGAFGNEIADMFWFEGPAAANPANLLDMLGEPLKAQGQEISPPQERQNIVTDVSGALGQLSGQVVQAVFAPQTLMVSLAAQGADIQQERAEASGMAGGAEADAAVILGAGVTAVTEKYGIDRLLNRLPPAIKNPILRKISDLAIAGGTEAVQELTENIAQDVITKVLTEPDHEIGQGVLREMFAAGSAATIMRAMLMGLTGARVRTGATEDQAALDAVVEASNQSRLRERDPARFAALVQQLRKEGADTVFVPVEEFQRLFQDPMAAARDVLGDPQDYVEATITGGDVAIPIDAYLTKVAPDHHAALSAKIRLRPDGMSAEEAAADDGGAERNRAVRDFLRSVREEPADGRVLDDVMGQLLQTGMERGAAERNAKVVDALFRTMGQRLGIPAWDLYSEYGLRVRRELPEVLQQAGGVDVVLDSMLDRLVAGDLPSEADAGGPTLAEFLSDQGGIRDDVLTGELRALAEDDKLRRRPGQRRLVNDDGGLELDRALTAAKEAGYLQEDADIQGLLDALSDEVRGERAMRSPANRNEQTAQARDALLALQDELARLGFDPATDREAIRAALRGVTEGQAFDQGPAEAFRGMTREEFLGDPRITKDSNAADLKPKALQGLGDPVPFAVGEGLTARYSEDGAAVFDGDTVVASYNFGDTLVVDKGRRRQGIAEELVYQWRTRYPGTAAARERTKASQAVQEKVWERIQRELEAVPVDEATGLPLNPDGTVTVYHHTNEAAAAAIRQTGQLQSAGEPDVYVTTRRETDTGYGDVAVPVRVRPDQLQLDDEFPDGRRDFRIDTGRPGGRVAVGVGEVLFQPAFHGSPHRFDRFSLSAIGTGEGAQAYGWGLYFAEKRDIAEFYRQTVSRSRGDIQQLARSSIGRELADNEVRAVMAFVDSDASPSQVARRAQNQAASLRAVDVTKLGRMVERMRGQRQGQLYQVEIPEDSDLLDWDKPLAEQSEKVRAALAPILARMEDGIRETLRPFGQAETEREIAASRKTLTGQGIYDYLSREDGSDRAASETLLSAGIPGLRYLDGTSRPGGEGSYNYVIWDEAAVQDVRTFYQSANDQTQTAEFKRWFGDSKVVDADGRPLVVYHGTRNDFDTFDAQRGADIGFHFGPADAANERGNNRPIGSKGNLLTMPVFLAIEKPLRVSDPGYFGIEDAATGDNAFFLELRSKGVDVVPGMSHRETIAAIEKAGYDGLVYDNEGEGGGDSWVAFRPEQIKSATGNRGTFDPNDPNILRQSGRTGTERGQIVLGRNADGSKQFTISLFEGADLSTFLHESGHFFLEVLADAAQRPDAPQQVRDDFAQILQWFGVENRDAIGVEQHEQFARGFEAYLFEGKAPSADLRGPFARFRAWLVSLYRNLRALNVTLTDDVRAVFDRMLATDEEINAASQEAVTQPAFTDAATAGMNAEQWDAYQRLVGEAREEAERTVTARIMDDVQREQRAWWREAREQVQAEVTGEVDARPVYQLLALLNRGKRPDGSPLPEGVRPVKLDKAWLLERYGQKFLNDNLLRRRLYTVEDGVNPDALAADWGYDSGDAMIQDLVNAPLREEVIKAETDQRMRERFGDMLTDGTLAEEALQAVHGNRRMRMLDVEISALAGKTGVTRPAMKQILRIAKERISAKRARDVQPGQYLRAERKAARESAARFAASDWRGAMQHKIQQALNAAMYAEARRVRDEVESGRDYLARFLKTPLRSKMGLAGGTYLDQIDALLERVDFKRAGLNEARRQSMAAFIKAQEDAGLQVDIPESLQNEAFRKSYRDMTVEEFRGLVDSVKNIEHLAKLKNRLLSAREKQEFDAAVDDMVASIEGFHDVADEPLDFSPSLRARFGEWLGKVDAWLTKPEFLFKWLDGDVDQGPVWRNLFRPFVDAERAEQEMQAEAAEAMRQAFAGLDRSRFAEKVFMPGLRASMTRAQMMSLALNWGNEGNREAIRRGYGWTDAQVLDVIQQLTAEELDAVEAVWVHIDSYWPKVADLQRKMTGLTPAKVEAEPFVVRGRTMRGGYYPLKYDSRRSWLAFKREEGQAVQELFGGNWTRAATRKGHTIERVGSAGQQVKLDLGVATEHVGNVIHDLTHRAAVIDVQRMLDDGRVRSTIERVAGRDMYRQLRPWIQNIASPNPQVMNPIDAVARRMRVGGSIVNMGWKVTTAIVQPLGYTQTVEAIGARWAARGLRDWLGSPRKLTQFALERSTMLRNRQQTFDRDVRDTLARLVDGSRMDDVRRSFFIMTGLMDMSVSVPTWLAAYRKAIEGAVNGVPGANEQAAIDYADSMVRMTQSSGAAKDLATIQGGGETQRLFTMFYSYFNVLYNIGRQRIRGFRGVSDVPQLAASAMWLWFIPAVLSELLAGRGPEDEEEWATWWQRNAFMFATYPVQTVPVLRDIINGMGRFGYSPSPAFDGLEATARVLNVPFKVVAGEELNRADAKAAVIAAGYWGQLPARQAWITGEYLFDIAEGEERPEDPAEFLGGLMFSRPAPQR